MATTQTLPLASVPSSSHIVSFPDTSTTANTSGQENSPRKYTLNMRRPRNTNAAAIAQIGLHGTCGVVEETMEVVASGPGQQVEEFDRWVTDFSEQNNLTPATYVELDPLFPVQEGVVVVHRVPRLNVQSLGYSDDIFEASLAKPQEDCPQHQERFEARMGISSEDTAASTEEEAGEEETLEEVLKKVLLTTKEEDTDLLPVKQLLTPSKQNNSNLPTKQAPREDLEQAVCIAQDQILTVASVGSSMQTEESWEGLLCEGPTFLKAPAESPTLLAYKKGMVGHS
ncbi:hypothetical protein BDK51DRAFT_51045 [Blyttiomyces helicus]|uniref:Uncharacterized protein n=1 Tax=Blyttiomyces helicus TaxID=388810 RepID=A0A4P9WGN0_9FUNG|nr:hypothetical protein BDK51DRAFT_51045 [Blyttiomyces helicus]|eukprot:RKO89646.1 hypothetical protein BDK51DRAFT_51045 [Blyttiomyces helicus]